MITVNSFGAVYVFTILKAFPKNPHLGPNYLGFKVHFLTIIPVKLLSPMECKDLGQLLGFSSVQFE